MDYGTFTAQTVGEAVDLVNLLIDGEATESDVRGVLHLYDLHDAPLDLGAFAQLAADIRSVFGADGTSRTVQLNRLLAAFEPSPFLAEHDGQAPHFHFAPDDGADARRVGASLTMALAHVVVEHGGDRLGTCAAPGCERVFADQTRNGNQRFCSRTCATRVHVAQHRARN